MMQRTWSWYWRWWSWSWNWLRSWRDILRRLSINVLSVIFIFAIMSGWQRFERGIVILPLRLHIGTCMSAIVKVDMNRRNTASFFREINPKGLLSIGITDKDTTFCMRLKLIALMLQYVEPSSTA